MTTVYYTTADLVKDRATNISSTLTDAEIQGIIQAAEGVMDAIMGHSFKEKFEATKHGIIREATTLWACIQCIDFDRSGFTSQLEANNLVERMYGQLDFLLTMLRDPEVVNWLKEQ